ncbi:MAG: multidrug effflux MFS transporter [Alphaproteobacteria bacterium]|nr:multidrug effflux MFS transporter [Alphaproteobacteria bacterium]
MVILILISLASLAQMGINIVLPALPQISGALGFQGNVQLVLTAFLVSFAAGMLIMGPISDQIGRKPVLLVGLVIFLVGGTMGALAESIPVMMASRVIQGIGAAAGMSVGRAVARDLFEGPQLVKVYGVLTMAMAVVPGLAPFLGGLLVADFGWRVVLAVPVVCAAVIFAGVALVVWETLPRDGAEERPERSEPGGIRAVLTGYARVLRSRIFVKFAVGNSLTLGGLYGFAAGSPDHFIGVMGYPPSLFGFLPMVPAASYLLGAFLASRIAADPRRFTVFYQGSACFVLAGGVGTLACALLGHQDIWPVMLFVSLYGIGMGGILPLGVTGAMQPFRRQAGTAAAVLGAMQMGAGALSTSLMALIPGDPLPVFASLMVGCAFGPVMIAFLAKPQLDG